MMRDMGPPTGNIPSLLSSGPQPLMQTPIRMPPGGEYSLTTCSQYSTVLARKLDCVSGLKKVGKLLLSKL